MFLFSLFLINAAAKTDDAVFTVDFFFFFQVNLEQSLSYPRFGSESDCNVERHFAVMQSHGIPMNSAGNYFETNNFSQTLADRFVEFFSKNDRHRIKEDLFPILAAQVLDCVTGRFGEAGQWVRQLTIPQYILLFQIMSAVLKYSFFSQFFKYFPLNFLPKCKKSNIQPSLFLLLLPYPIVILLKSSIIIYFIIIHLLNPCCLEGKNNILLEYAAPLIEETILRNQA